MSRPIPVSPGKWGEMVLALSEVRRLREENARLKAEVERLTVAADWKTPARKIQALEAEVERLRKAGDELAENFKVQTWPWTSRFNCYLAWNAAKEGKPSEQKSPSFIEDLGNGVEKHDLLFRHPDKEGKQP